MGFKNLVFFTFFCLYSTLFYAQKNDVSNEVLNDTLIYQIDLDEIVLVAKKSEISDEEKKQLQLLIRRVYKVYPYAKIASERLTKLNQNLAQLQSKKDKNQYIKLVEKYIETEFEDQLKKFSRKEGQVLVKLIHRQTGYTTHELIKDFKSNWSAFWYNKIGKLYDIDIKTEYDPFNNSQDLLIERILKKGLTTGRLQYQKEANPINYEELINHWNNP